MIDIRGELILVDRRALATLTGYSANTIRKRCPIAGRELHEGRRRPVYDLEVCEHVMRTVRLRPKARRT